MAINTIKAGNFVNPSELDGETRVQVTDGVVWATIQETITPDGSASYNLTTQAPANALIMSSQVKLVTDVVATTAIEIGLGTSGDPDKYRETTALTAATYGGVQNPPTFTDTSDETLVVQGTNGSGTAAGTLDSGGPIIVRVTFFLAEAIDATS